MDKKKINKKDLSSGLKRLAEINEWLENTEDADPEDALRKVEEAKEIVKEVRDRLKDAENEFREIKTDFEDTEGADD